MPEFFLVKERIFIKETCTITNRILTRDVGVQGIAVTTISDMGMITESSVMAVNVTGVVSLWL
jgi:hypothetical protein